MVGVPGSSPVAPTRDLENDVGNECRNDSERADGYGEHLGGVSSKKLIRVVRIFAVHFVESRVNFGEIRVDCVESRADPRSHLAEFGFGGCCQHHDVGASGRLFGIVGGEVGHC